MQIAILLFDRFAAIDAVTLHGALSVLPDADAAFVAHEPGPVRDDTRRLELTADAALHEMPRPDVLAVPGGDGAALAAPNGAIETWIGSAVQHGAWVVTVASGALLAARAGVLTGRRVVAPEHLHHQLTHFGAHPVLDRTVIARPMASARSTSSVAHLITTLATHLESKGIR
ncbi:DJ-1/PfpI family protein [Agromyces sp. NPDC058484]|uniref:DJ-1/PfpI family protein n=1 Tax=Agromyces sp. NPDC058484 TaxID=3346524 RepID=UPI003667059D